MSPTEGIRREVVLPALLDEVWEALTRSDLLSAWFGAEAELDPRPGGALRFVWPDGTLRRGLVESARSPTYLAFRWHPIRPSPEGISLGSATRVEFILEKVKAGTRLTLVESELSVPSTGPVGPAPTARARTFSLARS